MKKIFFCFILLLIPIFVSATSTVPFSRKYKCFWEEKNENLKICKKFYGRYCFERPGDRSVPPPPSPQSFAMQEGQSTITFGKVETCPLSPVCPRFTNPVYDKKGRYYPSACWAKHLGVKDFEYGISERVTKFISNLWREQGYIVPKPSVEFSMSGNWPGFKDGVFVRSTVWQDKKTLLTLDFNIHTNQDKSFTPSFKRHSLLKSPFGRRKALLTYVIFEEVYPEHVLLSETPKYVRAMNDYFKKKQNVKNPFQLDVMPMVMSPPKNLGSPDTNGQLTNEDHVKLYRAATEKIGRDNFDIFIYVAVGERFQGGYYIHFGDREFIAAPLYNTGNSYSTEDTESGIRSIWQLQNVFNTLSHELLHSLGLDIDHFPMGEGTYYLDFIGYPHIDHVTGEYVSGSPVSLSYDEKDECDFFGESPDYYFIKLPRALQVRVGKEPDWAMKVESATGPCIFLNGRNLGQMLKDRDHNGIYEIVYSNNLIGDDLQRILGWVDIDSDGIAELDDPDPYGGLDFVDESLENF